jgi:hypothetical protein
MTDEKPNWHHPECQGACLACLIEQSVQRDYGTQGLVFLRRHVVTGPQADVTGMYIRLEALSKLLEGSGRIDEHEHPDAYATILDAMAFVRRVSDD